MSRPDFESWVKDEIEDMRSLLVEAFAAAGVDYEPKRSAAPAPMLRSVAEAVQPAIDRLAEAVNDHSRHLDNHARALSAQQERSALIATTQDVKIIHRDDSGEISHVETVRVKPTT
jgi:hypothetical protein